MSSEDQTISDLCSPPALPSPVLPQPGGKRLRVLIHNNFGIWSARGLDIQFVVSGHSVQVVKQVFVEQLANAARETQESWDSLDPLLDVEFRPFKDLRWVQFVESATTEVVVDGQYEFKDTDLSVLPFEGITYLLVADSQNLNRLRGRGQPSKDEDDEP